MAAILGFFSKWRPARGRSSWRPAKIETVCQRGHMSQIWCFWKNLNQKSLSSLTKEEELSTSFRSVTQRQCTHSLYASVVSNYYVPNDKQSVSASTPKTWYRIFWEIPHLYVRSEGITDISIYRKLAVRKGQLKGRRERKSQKISTPCFYMFATLQ